MCTPLYIKCVHAGDGYRFFNSPYLHYLSAHDITITIVAYRGYLYYKTALKYSYLKGKEQPALAGLLILIQCTCILFCFNLYTS